MTTSKSLTQKQKLTIRKLAEIELKSSLKYDANKERIEELADTYLRSQGIEYIENAEEVEEIIQERINDATLYFQDRDEEPYYIIPFSMLNTILSLANATKRILEAGKGIKATTPEENEKLDHAIKMLNLQFDEVLSVVPPKEQCYLEYNKRG